MNNESSHIVQEAQELVRSLPINAGNLKGVEASAYPNPLAVNWYRDRYDRNIYKAIVHFLDNRDIYIEDAIAEAHSKGKVINYPPYTS
ncbi:MAG TPA: hypothetical protein VMR34_06245 [Candidatus Saccharimonadales bacterium]|nr:hypothetical protein [Candidatus Saccharimonadales bacterium]